MLDAELEIIHLIIGHRKVPRPQNGDDERGRGCAAVAQGQANLLRRAYVASLVCIQTNQLWSRPAGLVYFLCTETRVLGDVVLQFCECILALGCDA